MTRPIRSPKYENRFPRSEALGSWAGGAGLTINSDVEANPVNGELTADALVETGGASSLHTVSPGALTTDLGLYGISGYVKPAGRTFASFYSANGTKGMNVNLTTGATSVGVAGLIGFTAEAAPNLGAFSSGWWRVKWFTTIPAGGFGFFGIYCASALGTISYAGTLGLVALYSYGWIVCHNRNTDLYDSNWKTDASVINNGPLRPRHVGRVDWSDRLPHVGRTVK